MSVDDLAQLLNAIEGYSASTWITVSGLVLLYIALKQLGADYGNWKITWKKNRWIIATLALSVVLLVTSPVLAYWYSHSAAVVSPSAAFKALQENKSVDWLVRLIPVENPELTLDKLTTLGRPGHDFVFVADYEELKNYTVEEAIYKTGGSLKSARRVSAILFPRKRRDLFPANSRGILQVLQEINKLHAAEADYVPCTIRTLTGDALKHLSDRDVTSWSWGEYSRYYSEYVQVEKELRSQNCSAYAHLGSIGNDWHPAGYSRVLGLTNKLSRGFHLTLPDGTRIPIDQFGSRAFLIGNLRLSEIGDRVMIDFENPVKDRIPDLGAVRGGSPEFAN